MSSVLVQVSQILIPLRTSNRLPKKALDDGFTKYTPVGGIDELKDAIIKKFQRDNRFNL